MLTLSSHLCGPGVRIKERVFTFEMKQKMRKHVIRKSLLEVKLTDPILNHILFMLDRVVCEESWELLHYFCPSVNYVFVLDG